MPSDSDRKIRSIKDNPAGKVVADAGGNRWQWDSDDPTSLLIKKLHNDELALEQTGLRQSAEPGAPGAAADKRRTPDAAARAPAARQSSSERPRGAAAKSAGNPAASSSRPGGVGKPRAGTRDAGGGFNPYDSSGTPRRR